MSAGYFEAERGELLTQIALCHKAAAKLTEAAGIADQAANAATGVSGAAEAAANAAREASKASLKAAKEAEDRFAELAMPWAERVHDQLVKKLFDPKPVDVEATREEMHFALA